MHIRSGLLASLLAFVAAPLAGAPCIRLTRSALFTARPGWQAISVWYAKDLGLFAKYNVDVKHTSLNSHPAVMEAFISGQADMAVANVGTAVNGYFRGVPFKSWRVRRRRTTR